MQHIEDLIERNKRVELDKAWETSKTRRFVIAVITYSVAALFMYRIGVDNYLLNAYIPTGGYLLSTLSLPQIKRHWIAYNNQKNKHPGVK